MDPTNRTPPLGSSAASRLSASEKTAVSVGGAALRGRRIALGEAPPRSRLGYLSPSDSGAVGGRSLRKRLAQSLKQTLDRRRDALYQNTARPRAPTRQRAGSAPAGAHPMANRPLPAPPREKGGKAFYENTNPPPRDRSGDEIYEDAASVRRPRADSLYENTRRPSVPSRRRAASSPFYGNISGGGGVARRGSSGEEIYEDSASVRRPRRSEPHPSQPAEEDYTPMNPLPTTESQSDEPVYQEVEPVYQEVQDPVYETVQDGVANPHYERAPGQADEPHDEPHYESVDEARANNPSAPSPVSSDEDGEEVVNIHYESDSEEAQESDYEPGPLGTARDEETD